MTVSQPNRPAAVRRSRPPWVLAICLGALLARASVAGDMVDVLWPDSTFGDVEDEAEAIKNSPSELGYHSVGNPGDVNFDDLPFLILFEPSTDGVQLAAFSDDGVSVTITDTETGVTETPLERWGQPQPLSKVEKSLWPVPYSPGFRAGGTYEIRVRYLNTLYTGGGDIDGVKLFAFAGAAVATVVKEIEVDSGDGDSVEIVLTPKDDARVFPGQKVTLVTKVRDTDRYRTFPPGGDFKRMRTHHKVGGVFQAEITVTNAVFDGTTFNSKTVIMGHVGGGVFAPRRSESVRVSQDWDGQPIKVTVQFTDLGTYTSHDEEPVPLRPEELNQRKRSRRLHPAGVRDLATRRHTEPSHNHNAQKAGACVNLGGGRRQPDRERPGN